jgi:ribosomal protein S18 acetylase RimI-like enzyme
LFLEGGRVNMLKTLINNIFERNIYIVYHLEPAYLQSMNSIPGAISLEPISTKNIEDVTYYFPREKVPIFHEKLSKGCVGVFARHGPHVVGYQWRKDYDVSRTVKADGYIPLKGRFSHLHFARVSDAVRGRGILSCMMTYLVNNAFDRGFVNIYTDCEGDNPAANRGVMKFGFREKFRLVVINAFGRKLPFKYHEEKAYTLCYLTQSCKL